MARVMASARGGGTGPFAAAARGMTAVRRKFRGRRAWWLVAAAVVLGGSVALPVTGVGAESRGEMTVNGHALSANERKAVTWIARKTVPKLRGSAAERLDKAALVTWWSLKEGVLALDNPHAYSNCDVGEDGPFAVCPDGLAWQVGIAAIQVPDIPADQVEKAAVTMYPGSTADAVLAHTADYAGFRTGTSKHDRVVNSTGALRKSWLMRNHRVGFHLVEPLIREQCVEGTREWCFSTRWEPSKWYAPDKATAMTAVGEIRDILKRVRNSEPGDGKPDEPTQPGGDGRAKATVGKTDGLGLNVRAEPRLDSPVRTNLASGTEVTISCQRQGDAVTNTRNFTSTLWDYLPDHGGYVADAFMATGHDGPIPGVPTCGGSTPSDPPDDGDDGDDGDGTGELVPLSQMDVPVTGHVDCGPTSVVMALLAAGHKPHEWRGRDNPVPAIQQARLDMGRPGEQTTNGQNVMDAFATYGLTSRYSDDIEDILQSVRDGHVVVLSGNTVTLPWEVRVLDPNGVGHFLTVADYRDGQYLVLDPISREQVVHYTSADEVREFFWGLPGAIIL